MALASSSDDVSSVSSNWSAKDSIDEEIKQMRKQKRDSKAKKVDVR